MSRIVIDARMWGESGIGRYIRNLIFELQKLDHKNEYFVLLLKKDYQNQEILRFAQNDENNKWHKVLADFKWYTLAEQLKLSKLLNQIKPDLVHFPHFNVPILYRGKFVVTIHDLIHQHYAMEKSTTHRPIIHKIKTIGYNFAFKMAVKNSIKILTPSQFTKSLLEKEWNISGNKIEVTPEGVGENLLKINKEIKQEFIEKTLKKFAILPPFIFYTGNAHPHKNVEGLIKAFLEIQRSNLFENGSIQLVLVGNDNYFWQRLKMDSRFRQNDIVYTGFVTDEELIALYRSAQVYVQPSFEEGFGIPLLEAMSAGLPVVSSNAGSLKEVGRNAALYFDPHDLKDMENKIRQVLKNEKLRKDLIEKGLKRVKDFSWQKMAQQTLEVYNNSI